VSVDSQTLFTRSSLTLDGLLLEKKDEQAVSVSAATSATRVLCLLMSPD
jgi:hypothetical protein